MTRALAGLAELAAVAAALAGAGWWPLALAAHLVAAWLAGRGVESRRRDERLLVVALVLALPVLGLVGLG
ncbi:MAG TPA: DoxX family protein, partial [Candidatus Dormibacteraeota bacterium]|nr:DoxX family protein [Candidatus Dormibacteraeota bacterium]